MSTNARMEAIHRREEAEVLELCADYQERFQTATAAFETNPTPENEAARQAAMDELHLLRRWLRQGGRPVLPDGQGDAVVQAGPVGEQRPQGRKRRDA
ncbi:hypothetical protein [Microbispora sp. NPDC049633]|uniref:hypothetical protein n=1 Tax=Microbispora sp. NPDC049633 TaxID=3154355 RepID=UPI0034166B7E